MTTLKFHHIGRPVSLATIADNPATKYSSLFDMYSLDQQNDLTIPIELHAFGPNCSLDPLIQEQPHVAFTVDDIETALQGQEIIMSLYEPFKGYRCAMVLENGQPVELIETSLSEREIWGDGIFRNSVLYPDGDQR
ncbi:hypothetical protein GPK34_04015 [Secundilactobacillus kimchicus]|uniref:hypothetical protein n=1 Tax=Secundilactobacillus kimchicus TaxID=528209 RepID=UPI001C00D083|nr:hypothetical protein [Secundilactobacillus kimchicus]MBT9671197.1 hypothetical protein [Secundilactobacillus kimchicus]